MREERPRPELPEGPLEALERKAKENRELAALMLGPCAIVQAAALLKFDGIDFTDETINNLRTALASTVTRWRAGAGGTTWL